MQKITITDFSGGQNSYDIPTVIGANQGTVVRNAEVSRKGIISKRAGVTLFATDLDDTAFTGIGRFIPDANTDWMLIASGASICRSTPNGVWEYINTATPTAVGYDTQFVQANNILYILNGVNYPFTYNGSIFYANQAASDSPTTTAVSPPIAKYAAWFKNYMFYANVIDASDDNDNRDWIYVSDNLDPSLISATSIVKVNTGDGQQITGIKPFKNNELVVYKERSIWVLDISGTFITGWSLQPMTDDIGCIAPRSIVMVGNDQWFLSSEPIGVRSLVRTDLDKIKLSLVSTPIQDIFDGSGSTFINRTYINKAAAILYDNKYILAVPSNNSTVNDLVLVYDFITNSWTQITGWYVSDWLVYDNKLYFIDSTDGRVLQAFYGNYDFASGPCVTPMWWYSSSPLVKAINFHYESRCFNFDLPENYKMPDALDIVCESTGNYGLTTYINIDQGGWQNMGNMSLSGNSASLPNILPFTLTSDN